ncbi:MAG: hypothetical protein FH748_02500 [Balneolaceae bacterium]|nr:hypothetical protein [Balneolaceae bacterium]
MDQPRIERALKRLSIQIWERLNPEQEIVLIGLNERGYATATQISAYLAAHLGEEKPVQQFNVFGDSPMVKIPDCNDKAVFLIDDVIFSGKTMFRALSAICSAYEPLAIDIVTLLDRGHRRYPLLSELTGMSVPTKTGEHIEVMLKEGKLHQAVLFKNN